MGFFCSFVRMSVRPSTSTQFASLNKTFETDCSTLEQSIRQLKQKAASNAAESSSAGTSGCTRSACDDARLASRAKDLRSMTEQRFSEVITGWKNQSSKLEQELEMYKSQQRIGSERVMKRNAEIKKLRDENEKLTSLVRKCEERINQLFDAKEKEKHERMRADRLADQLFEHKAMINDLQSQLKEAERLLEATRTERDTLIVENAELKKTNCTLRSRLKEAERDTSETKLELEMIEDMVKSINEHSNSSPQSNPEPIAPREVPSALTALNILQTNHDSGIGMLNNEVKKLKVSEQHKTNELERLRHSLQE